MSEAAAALYAITSRLRRLGPDVTLSGTGVVSTQIILLARARMAKAAARTCAV